MMRMSRLVLLLVCVSSVISGVASADDKRCVDLQFTPTDSLQLVAWLETSTGTYVDTVFVTQQIGTFGLGNRPGRFDFNSGPIWPYGRRITTFPVWAHRHGMSFPTVLFQNDFLPDNVTPIEDPEVCFMETGGAYEQCGENNLSHPFNQSSRESHFCRPLMPEEAAWDTGTCATTAFTDKGRFSLSSTSLYPPRADVTPSPMMDSPSVDMYKALNPFDAVSQPTPIGGTPANVPWPVPSDLPAGDYVLWVEAAKEFDMNGSYDQTSYPPPDGLFWSEYGKPYRGQPSIVYRVPISIGTTTTTASTMTYEGYGDPTGADGNVRPPDSTITTDTPGSGAARLELVSDGSDMYRVRVEVSPSTTTQAPPAPAQLAPVAITASDISMSFVAPGIGTQHVEVAGYEIRIRASDEMTADNFEDSMPVTAHVDPAVAGTMQGFDLPGLLPETDYWIGIRAFDGCHNTGDLAITKVTTTAQISGVVDACFVATAAYGTLMANDVELLRHFRDSLLQRTALGELGVEVYYTFGPALAGMVAPSEILRTSARDALAPLVAWVRSLSF